MTIYCYFFPDVLSKLGLIEEEQNDVPIGKVNFGLMYFLDFFKFILCLLRMHIVE